MKISVVTVAFNSAATIGDTIMSVQAQTHSDLEHIIVDGKSTDSTMDVVKHHSNDKTVAISEADNGLYDAMNKGINMATGDVIGILNSDDYYADSLALSRVEETFRHNVGIDAVLGDIAFVDKSGKETRRYDSGRFRPSLARWGWMPAHPGMYLTRSAYNRIGQYRTDLKIAADFDFVVRAFNRAKSSFVHLPEVLVHMRPGGASTDGWNAKLTINREVVRACRENGVYTNLPMIMCKYPMKLLEMIR